MMPPRRAVKLAFCLYFFGGWVISWSVTQLITNTWPYLWVQLVAPFAVAFPLAAVLAVVTFEVLRRRYKLPMAPDWWKPSGLRRSSRVLREELRRQEDT